MSQLLNKVTLILLQFSRHIEQVIPRKIDKDFKTHAVRLVMEQSISVTQASADLGIGKSTLQQWIHEHKVYGESAFSGKGYLRAEDERLKRFLVLTER